MKLDNEGKIDITNDSEYLNLKSFYEETEAKLLDTDYFHCLLGKSFEDVTKNDNDNENEDNNDDDDVEDSDSLDE
jgi:hypothetical protein